MRRLRARLFLGLLFCTSLTVIAHPQGKHSADDLKGNIVGDKMYVNPALGMKITLPGTWDLLPPDSPQSRPPVDCRGPLCGNPEINLILQTKTGSSPEYRVYLSGYRLAPPYLNQDRYPLNKFAEVMLAGSLGGSGLVPIGTQSAIEIDGKRAYRLLTGKPGETVPKIIGYVSEANEYVFMLVLVARSASPQPLRSAVEAMTFGASAH